MLTHAFHGYEDMNAYLAFHIELIREGGTSSS